MTQLDMAYVQSQFPGLTQDWVFFDNAGGAQIAQPALDRMVEFLTHRNVQIGGSYAVSRSHIPTPRCTTGGATKRSPNSTRWRCDRSPVSVHIGPCVSKSETIVTAPRAIPISWVANRIIRSFPSPARRC